jgi:hypothetical protein
MTKHVVIVDTIGNKYYGQFFIFFFARVTFCLGENQIYLNSKCLQDKVNTRMKTNAKLTSSCLMDNLAAEKSKVKESKTKEKTC